MSRNLSLLKSKTFIAALLMTFSSFATLAGDWFEVRVMTAANKSSISRMIKQLKMPQDQVRIHESTAADKLVYILASEPFDSKDKAQQALSSRNYPKDAYVAKSKYSGTQTASTDNKTADNANDSTYFRLMQILGGVNMAYTVQQQKLAQMKKAAEEGEEKTLPLDTINCLSEVITRNAFANEFLPLYKNYFSPTQAGEIIFFAGIKEDPDGNQVLTNLKSRIDSYLTPIVKQELQQRMGFLSTRFVKRAITHCHIKTQSKSQN